jgi:LmbE family N-acetylglucosaminyl deacetylase
VKAFDLARPGEKLTVLALGAHSDDIELGAGGAILSWIASGAQVHVHWCVASAIGPRAEEATASARSFLVGAASSEIVLGQARDGYMPYSPDAKDWLESLKRIQPDVILTHTSNDAHQDHREISALTWNTFRDHLILEYEIPKWDGDLGCPNTYLPIADDIMARKCDLLLAHFGTQRGKSWFDPETFRALARLRGVECRARYAEAFWMRKVRLG